MSGVNGLGFDAICPKKIKGGRLSNFPLLCVTFQGCYGSVYALAQTAVSMAYGLGPLFGGQLVEVFGFPAVMCLVGVFNILYIPFLWLLKDSDRALTREDEVCHANIGTVQ